MSTVNQLSRQYRKLCKKTQTIDKQIQKLSQTGKVLRDARRACVQEIETTKLLIDYCVITGESPTQAQLSHTTDQIRQIVETHMQMNWNLGSYYDITLSHIQGTVSINSTSLGTAGNQGVIYSCNRPSSISTPLSDIIDE